MTDYVWFITATTSGFGQSIAWEAIRRGHKVIATARVKPRPPSSPLGPHIVQVYT